MRLRGSGACSQLTDITNAYFQAKPLTRLLLMSQPRGGLTQFDPEIPEDALLMSRVQIHGTKDAGRGLYPRVHGEIIKQGFFSSSVSPALCYKIDDEKKLKALLCIHVDDLLFCHNGKVGKQAIANLLGRFSGGKIEESFFAIADAGSHNPKITWFVEMCKRTQKASVPSVWMREDVLVIPFHQGS